MKLSNIYDSEPYRTISIGSHKFYWPFPISHGLHGSTAMVFGISVYGTDSRIIRRIHKVFRKIKDINYWFKYRFVPSEQYHIIRTGLKPAYYDIDRIMLYGNMALVCRYVEDEMDGEKNLQDRIDWLGEQNHPNSSDKEALEIYKWWKYEYQRNWDEYDKQLSDTFSGKMEWKKLENGMSEMVDCGVNKNAKMTPEELTNFEQSLFETEEKMLIRLMKIRRSLWT